MKRRGGPEGTRRSGSVKKIGQIGRSEVVNGLKCKQKDFERDAELDREPVKLLEDGGDVVRGGSAGDDTGCRVLDQLEFMEEFWGDTKEEGIAIINTGGDEAVN